MAPPSSLSRSSQKRIKLQDEDGSHIKELENKLTEAVSSNASLNPLADLITLAASLHEPHSVLKAIYACYRVLVLLISKGCLENSTDEQAKLVRTWTFERLDEYVRVLCGLLQDEESLLRVRSPVTDTTACNPHIEPQTSSLDILMSLLKHLSTSLSRSSPQPQFHVPHFKKVIDALLTCPPSERGGKRRSAQEAPPNKLDAEVRDQFVTKWLNVHADVRWFFLRDAECDLVLSCFCYLCAINESLFSPVLSSPKTNPFVPENLLFLLERLESFPVAQSGLKSWWVEELQAKPARSKKAPAVSEPDGPGTDSESDLIEDDWRKFFDEEEKQQKKPSEPSMRLHQMTVHQSLHSLASHRAVFTRLWLRLLPRLSEDDGARGGLSLRVLNVMHHGVMPHLTRAVLVMDWVGRCVDYGELLGSDFSFFF
jgi:U3 small nucleolar RNA-associated protein 19